jgi:hypothetical protein
MDEWEELKELLMKPPPERKMVIHCHSVECMEAFHKAMQDYVKHWKIEITEK